VNCFVCNTEIGKQVLQQPIKCEGRILPAHFNCGIEWSEKELEVFKITFGNSYYTLTPDFDGMEVGDVFEVEKVLMKQGEFYALPEFQGF
jgi:hypothetical protein